MMYLEMQDANACLCAFSRLFSGVAIVEISRPRLGFEKRVRVRVLGYHI